MVCPRIPRCEAAPLVVDTSFTILMIVRIPANLRSSLSVNTGKPIMRPKCLPLAIECTAMALGYGATYPATMDVYVAKNFIAKLLYYFGYLTWVVVELSN